MYFKVGSETVAHVICYKKSAEPNVQKILFVFRYIYFLHPKAVEEESEA